MLASSTLFRQATASRMALRAFATGPAAGGTISDELLQKLGSLSTQALVCPLRVRLGVHVDPGGFHPFGPEELPLQVGSVQKRPRFLHPRAPLGPHRQPVALLPAVALLPSRRIVAIP